MSVTVYTKSDGEVLCDSAATFNLTPGGDLILTTALGVPVAAFAAGHFNVAIVDQNKGA